MSKSNPPSHMRLANPMLRVLLVDDEPAVLRALRRALAAKRPTWQISTYPTPSAALASVTPENTDVVVSDYEMPEMTGVEMFKRLRRICPTSLRVILSGNERRSAGTVAPGLLHAWLPKTHTASELATSIEELIVRRNKARRSQRTG